MSYAWTIWKAQGQTIETKVVVVIGDKEREHRLTYTAFHKLQEPVTLELMVDFQETAYWKR